MRIFMFRSQAQRELQAFTGDPAGSKLPGKFAPWHATGVIRPESDPPHKFSRKDIESAIEGQGFQLWRIKASVKKSVTA
jgi:hypothetical protein